MPYSFARKTNRIGGVGGDIALADDINELQAAIEDISADVEVLQVDTTSLDELTDVTVSGTKADGDVLTWDPTMNAGAGGWHPEPVPVVSSSVAVQEEDSTVVTPVSYIDFDGSDFNVAAEAGAEARVSLNYGSGANQPAEGNHQHTSVKSGLTATLDGGGSVLATAHTVYVKMPFAATVTGWEVVGDVSGSVTVQVDRAPTATPASFSNISSSSHPSLSSQQTNKDVVISGDWSDVTLDEGDWLRFVVSGTPTSVKLVGIALDLLRTI